MFPKHKRIKNKKLIDEMRKPFCELCRKRTNIEPHHVNTVGSGGGDIPINLIQLCSECHIKAHSGLIKKETCEHMIAMREGISYEEVHRLNRKAMGYDV
ncbi:HNH endonuclease signature motif containing protein [Veillonella sp.]|uniref:HNH endonuclease signature motif containing protein n=1 Tax=Veillonella sp. TaxID=1926307 RepID=UPI0025E6F4C2|nr:HNH endonuclease signature motif containing protein [Veillonella sp.]